MPSSPLRARPGLECFCEEEDVCHELVAIPPVGCACHHVHRNTAGSDVGGGSHHVAVPPGRDPEGRDVREFGAFTADLSALAAWLRRCGIETVAMESTGVYWIPLFELLAARGFEVRLPHPRHLPPPPGA